MEISTVTIDSTIYYTTDGSTPNTDSTEYAGAISVSGDGTSMTIKAIAVKNGMKDSGVAEGSYSIDYPNLTMNTNGNGVVELTPNDLPVPAGTNLSLRSVTNAQNLFVGWTGAVSSMGDPITFTIETDTTIAANFEPQENFPNYLEGTIAAEMIFSSSINYTRTIRITNNSGSEVEVTKAEILQSTGYVSGTTTDPSLAGTLLPGETQGIRFSFGVDPGPNMVAKWYCDFEGYSFTVEEVTQ